MPSGLRRETSERSILRSTALGVLAVVAVTYLLTLVLPPAHAYVPPRPTIELVKMFQCTPGVIDDMSECGQRLEDRINGWLQEKQPSIRIIRRIMTTTDRNIFVAIFYEVPEWRTKSEPKAQPQKKLPAEAP